MYRLLTSHHITKVSCRVKWYGHKHEHTPHFQVVYAANHIVDVWTKNHTFIARLVLNETFKNTSYTHTYHYLRIYVCTCRYQENINDRHRSGKYHRCKISLSLPLLLAFWFVRCSRGTINEKADAYLLSLIACLTENCQKLRILNDACRLLHEQTNKWQLKAVCASAASRQTKHFPGLISTIVSYMRCAAVFSLWSVF